MTEPLRAGAASEPHQVSDPGYALGGALSELSASLWHHYAHELVDRALDGHTYRMLQAHPLYLLTVFQFRAGILTGQPNPDRFFLPALYEELDRAGVVPGQVHPSLNYGPAPSAQPPKG